MSRMEMGFFLFMGPIIALFAFLAVGGLVNMIMERKWKELLALAVFVAWIGTSVWLIAF